MKKRLLLCILLAIATLGCIACGANETDSSKEHNSKEEEYDNPEYVDFINNVIDKKWYIGTWGCNEYMYFSKDKEFDYEEECGRGTNSEYRGYGHWKYDAENKIITLSGTYSCDSDHEDYEDCDNCGTRTMTIGYVSCDENTLVVSIDNVEKTFTSTPGVVDENDYANRHPVNSSFIVNEYGVFLHYVYDHTWIQADESKNKISFIYNEETENEEFKYVTASDEPVEGFEQFNLCSYDMTTSQIILYNDNNDESKFITFIDYYSNNDTMILEIDGEEVTFTKK